jgi:hypothetical protein
VKENIKYLNRTLIRRVAVRGAVIGEGVVLVICLIKYRPRAIMRIRMSGIIAWKAFRRNQS